MSQYVTIPINENGIVYDVDMNNVITEAMAPDPFNYPDVYVYSHGWSNDAVHALNEYNRFSVDLSKYIRLLAELEPELFAQAPQDALAVGIHWPSEITEDADSDLNKAQLLTFYTMEHRADAVGKNAVYTILRIMLDSRSQPGRKAPRINLLGHSFGCKVVLAALQDVYTDYKGGTIKIPDGTSFNVVLLEPATDNDNLEDGDIYGHVKSLPNLRMLISTSQQDKALTIWFHAAGALANILHRPLQGVVDLFDFTAPPYALGAKGPTQATIDQFGKAGLKYAQVSVDQNFNAAKLYQVDAGLLVADLTPIHTQRVQQKLYSGGFSGSHSDINFDQIYQLVCGFLFGVANATAIPVIV